MSIDPTTDPRYVFFLDDDEFVEEGRPGFRRRIITGTNLELWFWRIQGGTRGSFLHRHDREEQLGIVMRGTLDFRIGGEDDHTRYQLRAGDLYLAPPTVWHGESIFIGDEEFNEVWILDVFAPPREVKLTRPDNSTSGAASADDDDNKEVAK